MNWARSSIRYRSEEVKHLLWTCWSQHLRGISWRNRSCACVGIVLPVCPTSHSTWGQGPESECSVTAHNQICDEEEKRICVVANPEARPHLANDPLKVTAVKLIRADPASYKPRTTFPPVTPSFQGAKRKSLLYWSQSFPQRERSQISNFTTTTTTTTTTSTATPPSIHTFSIGNWLT